MQSLRNATIISALACFALVGCGDGSQSEVSTAASTSSASDQAPATADPSADAGAPTAKPAVTPSSPSNPSQAAKSEASKSAAPQSDAVKGGAPKAEKPAEASNQLFAEVKQAAIAPEQKAALQDGKLTSAEFSALEKNASNCIAKGGITDYSFATGEESFTVPEGMTEDEAGAVIDDCTRKHVGATELLLATNGVSSDVAAAVSQCYVTFGVVDRFMSKEWRAATRKDATAATTAEMPQLDACLDKAHADESVTS